MKKISILIILISYSYFLHSQELKPFHNILPSKKTYDKTFPIKKLHFHFCGLIGKGLSTPGNTYAVYDHYNYKEFSSTEGFLEVPLNRMTGSLPSYADVAVNIRNNLRIGIACLPYCIKTFEGGTGHVHYFPWAYSSPCIINNGFYIKEIIRAASFAIPLDYVFHLRNETKKFDYELSPSIGLYGTHFYVRTDLTAADSTSAEPVMYTSIDERKISLGVIGQIKAEVFFGSWFSIFAHFYAGTENKMNIAEKSFTNGNVTAYVPPHHEQVEGLGFTVGIGLHFWKMKKQNSTAEN